MSKKKTLKSEGTEKYYTRAILPIPADSDGAVELLQGKLGVFPLYAMLLYSEVDEACAEFMRRKGSWLHSLSGNDCLIGTFENPGEWGESWKLYWRQKLGPDFEQISDEWLKMKPFDVNMAFFLADRLNVDKNDLPCVVFIEDFGKKEQLYVPIVVDQGEYPRFFQDLFTAVHDAVQEPQGSRLQELRVQYRKVWLKWVLTRKIKDISAAIKEWGSVIKETKEAIVGAFEPLTPFIKLIREAVGK